MLNDVLEDKLCFFYFIMVVSGKLFFRFQFFSDDNASHAFSMSRSVKWTLKCYFKALL